MQEIVELERRIAAALERIGRGIDALPVPAAPEAEPVPEPPAAEAPAEPAAPVEAAPAETAPAETAPADEDRGTIQRLRQRLAAARDRETALRAEYDERVAKLTRQLDVGGLELQRMRKATVLLREELRRLREAQSEGVSDPSLINRALLAELDSLRAIRLSEVAELDDLAAALDGHLAEAELAAAEIADARDAETGGANA